jgi:hypothetical protein
VNVSNDTTSGMSTECSDPDLHYQLGVDVFIAGGQAAAGDADMRQHPAGPAQGGGEPLR